MPLINISIKKLSDIFVVDVVDKGNTGNEVTYIYSKKRRIQKLQNSILSLKQMTSYLKKRHTGQNVEKQLR
jgi:hypothetical protein